MSTLNSSRNINTSEQAYLAGDAQIASLVVARRQGHLPPGAFCRGTSHHSAPSTNIRSPSPLVQRGPEQRTRERRELNQGVGSEARSSSAWSCSMRVPGILGGNLALTHHFFAPRIPRTFYSLHLAHTPPILPLTIARMASDNASPEWPAQKVREIFLEYFKQNGHTFGEFDPAITAITASPLASLDHADGRCYGCSPVLSSRSTVRSDPAFHKCGHESIQVHLLGHRGPLVRFCEAATCSQFAKGNKSRAMFSSRPVANSWMQCLRAGGKHNVSATSNHCR